MGWFGFWIFMAIFFVGDCYMHSRGMDTFFWSYKTPAELEIQKNIIHRGKP